MIYVLKSRDLVKVGYTKDFSKRLQAYKNHNPDIEVVKTYEDLGYSAEQFLHRSLSGIFNVTQGREWYCFTDDFMQTLETLITELRAGIPISLVRASKENPFTRTLEKEGPSKEEVLKTLLEVATAGARSLVLYILYGKSIKEGVVNLKVNDVCQAIGAKRSKVLASIAELKSLGVIAPKQQSVYWLNPDYFMLNVK